MLAAWRGNGLEAGELIRLALDQAMLDGSLGRVAALQLSRAVLENGEGRYEEALLAARQASEGSEQLPLPHLALTELIEAAARCGAIDQGLAALERLTASTAGSGSEWALGLEARSRALLEGGEFAEGLYREAIDRLGRTGLRAELARAHLVYGEWLRREQRRVDAREQLRTAQALFVEMGCLAFANRAERELVATGESTRRRSVETRGELTAQESEIARMASDGLSNREIGLRLFISPRTVEWHLHQIFVKLGLRSRKELRGVFAAADRRRALRAGVSWVELAGIATLSPRSSRLPALPLRRPVEPAREYAA